MQLALGDMESKKENVGSPKETHEITDGTTHPGKFILALTNQGYADDFLPCQRIFGEARFQRYFVESRGDLSIASELCKWNLRYAGVLHEQIGIVEIAVRNAVDRSLRQLCIEECGDERWTIQGNEPVLIDKLLQKQLQEARSLAISDRHAREVTHDDILSKLMWGTWIKIVGRPQVDVGLQSDLWRMAVHAAFPNIAPDESGRRQISKNLYFLRFVRNRAAHFDNLQEQAVQVQRVINASLYLLHAIDNSFSSGWMSPSRLRQTARERSHILAM
jgi:hypothetical protein